MNMMHPPSCKPFSRETHESAFKRHPTCNLRTTTVYLLRPPKHLSSNPPCIFLSTSNDDLIFRHPLTSKPLLTNLPLNFDIRKLNLSTLAVSHYTSSFDKLLVISASSTSSILFALYDGGQVRVHLPYLIEWVKLPAGVGFKRIDDVVFYKGNVYVLGRMGTLCVINIWVKSSKIRVGKHVISSPGPSGSATARFGYGRFGWRKRVVVDGQEDVMYLVVRIKKCMLNLYKRVTQAKGECWEMVKGFDGGNKVLFMTRDYYFFRRASKKFPGMEYSNCIVFTEGAFPEYGNGCWEFSQFSEQLGFECNDEEDVAIFRLSDECFCREGDNNSEFPLIDWSLPGWIYDALSVSDTEFQPHSSSESLSSSGSELEDDKGLDSDRKYRKNGEVQAASKVSKIKDELEEMESDSDSRDEEDQEMQCDININSQGKEDAELHVNANLEGSPSLQQDVSHVSPSLFRPEPGTTDTQTPSISATENEITRTLLSLNGGNHATEEGNSRKNITELLPRACTSSKLASHKSDPATAKFKGFDIRHDSVSTLEKIWRNHGNIVENSVVRNGDIIARAMESIATMVRILEDNSAMSLSDSQAKYLVSTLSDLRCIGFNVNWLIPFVEKAEKIHKSKPMVDYMNNLRQLSSQDKERRAML